MKKQIWLMIAMVLLLTTIVVATQPDVMTVLLRPLTSGGLVQANKNFDYEFNFTSDNACSTVLYAIQKNDVVTSVYGEAVVELNLSSLTTVPEYVCEYQNSSLIRVHNFSSPILNHVRAQTITVAGNITGESNVTSWLGSLSNWFHSIYSNTFYEAGVRLIDKYLTIDRWVTDNYNKTEIEGMNASIRATSTGLTLDRAETDYYNQTILETMNDSIREDAGRGNTSTEIWKVTNNGTFLALNRVEVDYYNKTESELMNTSGYTRGNTTSEIWGVANNGTFAYITDLVNQVGNWTADKIGYLSLARWTTDSYNKTEIEAMNDSIRSVAGGGNTSEEMVEATKDTYVNLTGDTMTGNLSFTTAALNYIKNLRGIQTISSSSFLIDLVGNSVTYFRENDLSNIFSIHQDKVVVYDKNFTVDTDLFVVDSNLNEVKVSGSEVLTSYDNLTKQDIENYGFRPLDQDLNTTSDVLHNSMNISGNFTMHGTNDVLLYNNGTHLIID